jgi:hypothetical protein
MSEGYQEAVEVEGSFADLGLDQPGSYVLPTKGWPIGTHHCVVKSERFVANKSDPRKKNIELVYECDEAGSTLFGKTQKESKPANNFDTAVVKGFLVDRYNGMGVADLSKHKVGSLVGTPVYVSIINPKPGDEWTRIGRVTLDTDGEFTPGVQPPVHTQAPPQNVAAADSLGY